MKFKEQLRQLRERAGLTQLQLAEKAGIPLGSLRNHEQGHRIPSWGAVVRLAAALGVDCTAFAQCEEVNDQPEPPPTPKRKPGPKGKGKK